MTFRGKYHSTGRHFNCEFIASHVVDHDSSEVGRRVMFILNGDLIIQDVLITQAKV